MKLNQKALSQILNVTPQNVGDLTKRGRIVRDPDGLYNLSEKENRAYLKEKGIDIKNIKIPNPAPAGRPVKPRSQGTIKNTTPGSDDSQSDLKKENIRLKNEKIKADLEIINKNYMPVVLIENVIMKYISQMHTNIERIASVSLSDYSSKILSEGAVTPAMIESFTNLFLETIHNTKLSFVKSLNDFQEGKL